MTAAVIGLAALAQAGVAQAGAASRQDPVKAPAPQWRLVSEETFRNATGVDQAPWVRDPQGDASPWQVDHLDDDGEFFRVRGGPDFDRQLAASAILRKRVAFGTGGWLTAELAARDLDNDGVPEAPPSLRNATVGGQASARIEEPSHDAGIIIRNSRPLPARYRIEYTLRQVDFGGKRNGSWNYSGKVNGYAPDGCKTNWPWKRSGDFSGLADRCNPNFADVRAENGFYYLTIVDYANPAPHNNVFLHHHRKVGMDGYNVNGSWSSAYSVCNPATRTTIPYPDSTANGINAIFFDGSRFRSPEIGYNELIMPTACGVRDGADPAPGSAIVSAAELRPELAPKETYRFAIERDATGYTTEMTGNFLHIGRATLRYHRNFVEDGRPIWHYNQTPAEYDGAFNSTLTFSGLFGSYTEEQWPAGSAYPDYFVLGDPHLNYYEGSAAIDDIRLYVPAQ